MCGEKKDSDMTPLQAQALYNPYSVSHCDGCQANILAAASCLNDPSEIPPASRAAWGNASIFDAYQHLLAKTGTC